MLAPGSKAFNIWKDPPALILRKFYLLDIMNPDAVQNGTEKPHLVQRGPYAYK